MTEKIRLGIIGANSDGGWAPRSHLPAVAASEDFALTAVCTTRMASAEETARRYGASMAFDDYREMVVHPDIDAVAVVVRVPLHFEPTKAALAAGKAVFTEWRLGRTTEEAIELARIAERHEVKTAVGLQARTHPVLMHARDLVASGFVGALQSCNYRLVRSGTSRMDPRPSNQLLQSDITLGANTFTIANGHTLDALRFIAGELASVAALVSTQVKQWRAADTGQLIAVNTPDNVLFSATLTNGAVLSGLVATVPFAGGGYRLELYGDKGTLVVTGEGSPQSVELRLFGAPGDSSLSEITIPSRYFRAAQSTPAGTPYFVGQLYHEFARTIRGEQGDHPDFDTAVSLHRTLDAMWSSATSGKTVAIGAT